MRCRRSTPRPRVQGVEISLILGEPEDIGAFVGVAVSELVLDIGILLSVFGYMFFMQPLLALVCLAIFFPQLVFVPLMQRAINRRVRSRIAVLRQASAGVLLTGTHDVEKALKQEMRFAEVFQLNLGIVKLRYSMKFLMNLTHNIGRVVVLGVGGWYVINGQAEVGMVVAFVSGLNNVRDPWGDLVNWYQDMMVTRAKYRIFAAAMEKFARGEDPLSVRLIRFAPRAGAQPCRHSWGRYRAGMSTGMHIQRTCCRRSSAGASRIDRPESSGISEPSASRTRPLVRLTFTASRNSGSGPRLRQREVGRVGRRARDEPCLELPLQRLNRGQALGDARSNDLVGIRGLQARDHHVERQQDRRSRRRARLASARSPFAAKAIARPCRAASCGPRRCRRVRRAWR